MPESYTVTQQQAPYIEDASRQLVAGTQDLINSPYQNYNELGAAGAVDPRLAGFSPDQIQAFDLAQQGVGAYQPYLDTAGTSAAAAQTGGINSLQAGAGYSGDLSQYQNPFQQQVIDATMLEMNRQQGMQQDQLDAGAAQGGSFGGARHGIAESEMERGHDQNRAAMTAQLNQQGYQAAQSAQEQHRQRQIQAGLGMGQIGLDTARVQSGLGALTQQMNQGDISTLGTTGGAQQQQLQQQYDINYNQWLDEQQDPYRRAAFQGDIIQGTPSSGNSMVSGMAPQRSTLAQGIGALGQMGAAGQQFGWWGNPNNATTA